MSGIDEKPLASIEKSRKIRAAIRVWLDYYEEHIKWMFEPDPFYLASKDLTEYLLNERDRGETS